MDLAEEGFDVVVRLTDHPPEALAARPLGEVEFVLCAAPAYLDRHGAPLHPGDLARHNCICQGHPAAQESWRFESEAGAMRVRVAGNAAVSGSQAVRQLLLAGLGCGILPDFVAAEDLHRRRLIPLMPGYRPIGPFRKLHALYLPSRQGDAKVRAWIDYLAAAWAGSPST